MDLKGVMKNLLIPVLAIGIEFVSILLLVLIVLCFGPANESEAQAFAERVGYWFGPLSGFVLCFVTSYFVARSHQDRRVQYGIALGASVALIDILILLVSGAQFQMIFVISNVGRVIAGAMGAWLSVSTNKEENNQEKLN